MFYDVIHVVGGLEETIHQFERVLLIIGLIHIYNMIWFICVFGDSANKNSSEYIQLNASCLCSVCVFFLIACACVCVCSMSMGFQKIKSMHLKCLEYVVTFCVCVRISKTREKKTQN